MFTASGALRQSPGCLVVALLVLTGCSRGDDRPVVSTPVGEVPADASDAPHRDAVTGPHPAASGTTRVAPTPTTLSPDDLAPLRPALPPGDPVAVAAQIAQAERTIRDTSSTGAAVSTAALVQQLAYRTLARHPEWVDQVTTSVPEPYRLAVLRNVYARQEFEAMHTRRSATVPAWQIVAPEPLETLQAAYQEAAAAFGLQWPHLAAIHLVETGTGRIRGVSSAGAQGPMQFLPATWAAYGGGGDVNDTRDAIFAAARYLATNNGAVDIANALWNYNHSDHYVRGVMYYADLIAEHPLALRGFYGWGIWYVTDAGDAYLPIGYQTDRPISAVDYITARPPYGS